MNELEIEYSNVNLSKQDLNMILLLFSQQEIIDYLCLTYDPQFIELILEKYDNKFEMLPFILNFSSILKKKINKEDIIFSLKKLISIYFAFDWLSENYPNLFDDILLLTETISKHHFEIRNNTQIVDMLPDILNLLFEKINERYCRLENNDIFSQENRFYYVLVNIMIELYSKRQSFKSSNLFRYFSIVFGSIEITDSSEEEKISLLRRLIEIVYPLILVFDDSLDYINITIQLMKLLGNQAFPLEGREDFLKAIVKIAAMERSNYCQDIIFEDKYSLILTNFFVEVIHKYSKKVEFTKYNIIEYDDENIDDINSVYIETKFPGGFQFLEKEQVDFFIIDVPTQYDISLDFPDPLYRAIKDILILCNDKTRTYVHHTKLLNNILSLCEGKYTHGILVFICLWINNTINLNDSFNTSSSIKMYQDSHIFYKILRAVFIDTNFPDVQYFVCESILSLTRSQNDDNLEVLNDFLNFALDRIFLCHDNEYINFTLVKSVFELSNKVSKIFEKYSYDEKIVKLILRLRNLHVHFNDDPNCIVISAFRCKIFDFITLSFHSASLRTFFIKSELFIKTLFSILREREVSKYVLQKIRDIIFYTGDERFMILSHLFRYMTLFFDDLSTEFDIECSKALFSTMSEAFYENRKLCSLAYLKFNFFDTLLSYCSKHPDQNNAMKVIDICNTIYKLPDSDISKFGSNDIFIKLYPVFESFKNDTKIFDDLYQYINFLTFNEEKTIIISGGALTLLFKNAEESNSLAAYFDQLVSCITYNDMSLYEICSSSLPAYLLDFIMMSSGNYDLFDKAISLLGYFMNYLKTKDVHSMFRLFTHSSGNSRPFYTKTLINQMINNLTNSDPLSPNSIFYFNGDTSIEHIFNQSIENKLDTNNFSFYLEINFSQINQMCDIITLRTADSKVISLHFEYPDLYIKNDTSTLSNKKKIASITTFNRWIRIFIHISLKKVKFYSNIAKNHMSTPMHIDLSQKLISITIGKSYNGKIGTLGLANAKADESLISDFFGFDSNKSTFFHFEKKTIFSGNVYKNIISFNPSISKYGKPISNCELRITENNSTVRIYDNQGNLKDIILKAGGASLILPLFSQICNPIVGVETNDDSCIEIMKLTLEVLHNLLCGSSRIQKNFEEIKGFRIVSYLLSYSGFSYFIGKNDTVIELFEKIFASLNHISIKIDMIQNIYLNPKLWIYCAAQTQIKLYESLLKLIKSLTDEEKIVLTNSISFADIMLILLTSYWTSFISEKIHLFSDNKIVSVNSQNIELAKTRDVDEIRNIGAVLWEVGETLAEIGFSKKDSNFLILCLTNSIDTFYCLKCAMLFYRLVRKNDNLLEVLRDKFSIGMFLPLIRSEDEAIRVYIVCSIVSLYNASKDMKRFLKPLKFEEWLRIFLVSYQTSSLTSASLILYDSLISEKNIVLRNIFPFVLLVISKIPDVNTFSAMIKRLQKAKSLDIYEIEHYLLLFYISMNRSESKDIHDIKHLIIEFLYNKYHHNPKYIGILRPFFNYISSIAGVNYLFVLSDIFSRFFKLAYQRKDTKIDFIAELITESTKFLCYIPHFDSFYNFSLDTSCSDTSPSYELVDLFNFLFESDFESFNYNFGFRVDIDKNIIDKDLIDTMLKLIHEEFSNKVLDYKGEDGVFSSYSLVLFHVLSISFDEYLEFSRKLALKFSSALDREKNATSLLFYSLYQVYHSTKRDDVLEVIQYFIHAKNKSLSALAVELTLDNRVVVNMISRAIDFIKNNEKNIIKDAKIDNNISKGICGQYRIPIRDFRPNKKDIGFNTLIQEFVSDYRNGLHVSKHLYKNMLSLLAQENGPWSKFTKISHFYKVGNVILGNFTKPHFRENKNFDLHTEASVLRKTGTPEDAKRILREIDDKMKQMQFTGEKVVESLLPEENESLFSYNNIETDNDYAYRANCLLVCPTVSYPGKFILSNRYMLFLSNNGKKYFKIALSNIKYLFRRKFINEYTAIEIYTHDYKSRFFNFGTDPVKMLRFINRQKIKEIKILQVEESDIDKHVKEAQNKWMNGDISNFEYIMLLNIFSGRTYNDLSQYPVFPWVLLDFSSEVLDLSKSESFRDFSMPMGKLNQYFNSHILAAYRELNYYYASFYSNTPSVAGYLIRQEPFTTIHINLQSGHFDLPDRIFTSIPGALKSIKESQMDFRELIPEFFYSHNFLLNENGFNLGMENSDVILPPWAKTSFDFICKHREALESPFVSQNIHKWINLIFGYQMKGPEAHKAQNVFHPFFYEDALKSNSENEEKVFMKEYAEHFGASPLQLFKKEHPIRSQFPLQAIKCLLKEVVVLKLVPFQIGYIHNKLYVSSKHLQMFSIQESDINMVNEANTDFTFSLAFSNGFMFTNCESDPVLYMNTLTLPFESKSLELVHTSKISVMKSTGSYLVTGSFDSSLALWIIDGFNCAKSKLFTYHKTPITCVDINEEANDIISCSYDGQVILHSIKEFRQLRILVYENEIPKSASISNSGHIAIVFYQTYTSIVRIYAQNLDEVSKYEFPGDISEVKIFDKNGSLFVLLSILQNVYIYKLPNFDLEFRHIFLSEVKCITFVNEDFTFYIGCSDGSIYSLSV